MLRLMKHNLEETAAAAAKQLAEAEATAPERYGERSHRVG